jgi:hypothetical protein
MRPGGAHRQIGRRCASTVAKPRRRRHLPIGRRSAHAGIDTVACLTRRNYVRSRICLHPRTPLPGHVCATHHHSNEGRTRINPALWRVARILAKLPSDQVRPVQLAFVTRCPAAPCRWSACVSISCSGRRPVLYHHHFGIFEYLTDAPAAICSPTAEVSDRNHLPFW